MALARLQNFVELDYHYSDIDSDFTIIFENKLQEEHNKGGMMWVINAEQV